MLQNIELMLSPKALDNLLVTANFPKGRLEAWRQWTISQALREGAGRDCQPRITYQIQLFKCDGDIKSSERKI